VVVEDDLLDPGIQRDRLQITEPAGMRGLDDDQAADRAQSSREASRSPSSSACRR
jgi:hypothetical protein